MSKRFLATVLIASGFFLSTTTVQSVAQRRRDLPKRTIQVKKPPVPGDVAPTRSQELWVNIFPVGMQIFGLDRDVRDPNTIYARTHRGLYKTSNGGMYWRPLFLRGTQFLTFAQSPSSPNVMYLGTSDWEIRATDIFMPVPFGGRMENGTLLRSDNYGQTWKDINAGNIIKGAISQVAVDPRDPSVVYASASELFKSSNSGRTWASLGRTGGNFFLNPWRPDNLIQCGLPTGVFVARWGCSESTDGGLTWREKEVNFQTGSPYGQHWTFFMFHPTNKAVRLGLASVHGSEREQRLFISQDDGVSWADISIFEGSDDNRWPAQITCLEFSLQSDQVIYAGTEAGWYVSKNRGTTWRKLRSFEPVDHRDNYSPSWLIQRSDEPVDIATGAADELYIATGLGIFKSSDGGSSWHRASLGLPTPTMVQESQGGLNKTTRLVASPEFIDEPSNLIYVSSYGSYSTSKYSNYWISKDGGLSWHQHSVQSVQVEVGAPLPILQIIAARDSTIYLRTGPTGPNNQISKIAPDGSSSLLKGVWKWPNLLSLSPSDSRKLWLAVWSGTYGETLDLLTSDDGGFSWRIVDLKPWFRPPAFYQASYIPIIAVSPQSFDTTYLVGASFVDQSFTLQKTQVLLATNDGGTSWRDVFPSLELSMRKAQPFGDLPPIASVIVNPKDPRGVYVMTEKQVFRSENGGLIWNRLPTALLQTPFKDLAINPSEPNVLYLASDHAVFRSTDSGKTWSFSDRGFAGDSISRLMVSSSIVLARGNNGIYRMSDDRLSWAVDGWQRMEKGENSLREWVTSQPATESIPRSVSELSGTPTSTPQDAKEAEQIEASRRKAEEFARISIAGTTWQGTSTGRDKKYFFSFDSNGTFHMTLVYWGIQSAADGFWTQNGTEINVRFVNTKEGELIATIKGQHMQGERHVPEKNKTHTYRFIMQRVR